MYWYEIRTAGDTFGRAQPPCTSAMRGAKYSSQCAAGSALVPFRSTRPFQSLLLHQTRPAAHQPCPTPCSTSISGTTAGSLFPSLGDEPDHMAARVTPTPAMTMDVESLITRLSSGAAAVVSGPSEELAGQLLSMQAFGQWRQKRLMAGLNGSSYRQRLSSKMQHQSKQLGADVIESPALHNDGSSSSPQPLIAVPPDQNKRTPVQLRALLDVLRSDDGPAPGRRHASSVPPSILRALERSQNQEPLRADLKRADAAAFKWALPDGSGATARTTMASANPSIPQDASSSSAPGRAGASASAARPHVSAMRGLAATAAGMLEAALPGRRAQHQSAGPSASPWPSAVTGSLSEDKISTELACSGSEGSSDSSHGSSLGRSQAPGSKEPVGRYRYLRSAARGAIRQRALWVMEEEAMSLPSGHPEHQEARKRMNRLLVLHTTAPSSTWRDVCQALEEFGAYLDPISLGCMLLTLARKGPTPARLRQHLHENSPPPGLTVSSESHSLAPVLLVDTGKSLTADAQLLRKALSLGLRLAAASVEEFPSGAVATTLHALSLLLPPGSPRDATVDLLASTLLARLGCMASSASPRTLSLALYSVARLGYRPKMLPARLLRQLLGATQDRLGLFTPQELCTFIASLSQLGLSPTKDWLEVFFCHVQGRLTEMDPGDALLLLRTILARSKLNDRFLPHRTFMEAFLSQCGADLTSFRPNQVSGFVVSLAQMGYSPSTKWMGSLKAYVTSNRLHAAFTPGDASQLLGALASLRCRNDLLVDVLPLLVKAVAGGHQGVGGRTLSRTLGAVTVLLHRLEGAAGGAQDIPAEWGDVRVKLVPMISDLQPAVLRVARQCLEHSCLPEEAPGGQAAWKKKLGGAAAASAEAEKEHKLDLFLLLQLTSGILELLGPRLLPACLAELEEAVARMRTDGGEAPGTSWRRLAAAYQHAGIRPGSKSLVRELLLLT